MPRPSLATLATLLLTGLAIAPAGLTQGILDVLKPAKPAPAVAKGQLLDRVVALVGEGIVTQSELDEAIASYVQRETQAGRRSLPPDRVRRPMLDELVRQELQLQRAERGKITVSEEELQETMAELARREGIPLADLPAAMKAQGVDYEERRDFIRRQLLINKLQRRDVLQHINVTPRELDQRLERLKNMPGEDDDYDVSDILIAVPAEPTRAEVDEQQKKAQEIYERTATEDFARLATTYSNARTALDGGRLDWRKGADLPSDLAAAIVALKPGEVSRPFLTPSGFHIVKLNAVRRAEGDPVQDQVHVRHILIRPDKLQDDATVRLKLVAFRQKILAGEDFAAFAATQSQDAGSAVDGGQLEWMSPDLFESEFADVVKGLKENEISEPFQTRYGWHIVQLLGRRQFDITEDAMRQRAFIQLRDSRAEEEIELWLRQMHDEAFIEIIEPKT